MSNDCTLYQSYLLRLWRNDAGEVLHASLQSTASGGIFHLKDMHELLAFLSSNESDGRFGTGWDESSSDQPSQ